MIPDHFCVNAGRGITGTLFPGCPETFEESQQGQSRIRPSLRSTTGFQRDRHQKIRHFREGDILAFPAGIAHWCYNDGDTPVVAVALLDTTNNANQLDQNPRVRNLHSLIIILFLVMCLGRCTYCTCCFVRGQY